jgi:hypothetical protein
MNTNLDRNTDTDTDTNTNTNTNTNKKIILTIAIQMHGKVFTYELDDKTSHIFDNVRLLCKAGGFKDYQTYPIEEFRLKNNLSNYYRRNIDQSTYDLIRQSNEEIITNNITFNKTLSTTIGEPGVLDYLSPLTRLQGIYLIAVHEDNNLVYPQKETDKTLNLLIINDLKQLSKFFKKNVNISSIVEDLSTPFPKQQIYIDEELLVKQNTKYSDEEKGTKITEIRQQFYNALNNWSLTLNQENQTIDPIKLSVFVELIKRIVGKNCFINLLDYSCNSASIYTPKEQLTSSKYMTEPDIEQGLPNNWGGKKTRRRRKNRNKRGKKSRRNRRRG